MGKKIRVKHGSMSIDVDTAARDIFLDVLKAIPGDTIKLLEKATDAIERSAYKKWPVQKPVSTDRLTKEGKVRVTARNIYKTEAQDYNLKRAFAASYKMQQLGILRPPEFQIKSKGSRDKLYTAFVFSGSTIEAVVGNTAQYAWAIKAGKDTDLYKEGTRIASKLLWEPARRRANTIASKMADAAIEAAKKVK